MIVPPSPFGLIENRSPTALPGLAAWRLRGQIGGTLEAIHSRRSMSALPPKADITAAQTNVRFVPKADIRILFEQLIGALLEKWRYVETERFGSL